MKEKRSKKESNKEVAKKEGRNVTVFASFSEAAAPQENLKIDWPSFILKTLTQALRLSCYFNVDRYSVAVITGSFEAEKSLPLRVMMMSALAFSAQ